ncbi:hypothetical protein RR48_05805 [Papilio machaon]|uniref:Uncharacterized protein n=1 Tax=Papilio machaon TaxID=76193 RepID=A0A0N1IQ56_PAPMA|nr:hypothetical protein RR48_05805 [Papilio machaon]
MKFMPSNVVLRAPNLAISISDVVGNRDRVSQQIQIKLGDYQIAQTLLDDPSKSIGICADPPSPAPCEYIMQSIT